MLLLWILVIPSRRENFNSSMSYSLGRQEAIILVPKLCVIIIIIVISHVPVICKTATVFTRFSTSTLYRGRQINLWNYQGRAWSSGFRRGVNEIKLRSACC